MRIVVCLLAFTLAVPALAAAKRKPSSEAEVPSRPKIDKASTSFSLDLMRRISEKQPGKNIFFSPYSVQSALAMTSLGATGDTLSGMTKALQLGAGAHKDFANAQKAIRSGKNEVAVVNKIWPQEGAALVKGFLRDVKTHYNSEVEAKDFARAFEPARTDINAWVEKQTRERIKDLLPEGSLDSLTRMVLTNAVYFKGQWAAKFDEKLTREADFIRADSSKSRAMMMNRKGGYYHYESPDFQALSMPYLGNELAMVALLPQEGKSIESLAASLGAADLERILAGMRHKTVHLSFPKFKLTYSAGLKGPLVKMGMEKAFSASADFSKMMAGPQLSISEVFHKAFIENNEIGTEAAAATAVVVGTRSFSYDPEFRADRPFLYFIVHNATGRILFLGQMMDAAAE